MKRALPPYVYDKKGVLYFQRRGHDTVKIAFDRNSPEFHAEYARLLAGERPIYSGPRTFKALVNEYRHSPRYKSLAPRTVADYEGVLEWVTAKLGALPVAAMQRKDVIRAQSVNADRQRFANYIVQVLRILFEYSIDLGWRKDNPAKGVHLLKSTKPPREAWPQDKVDAFRAVATGRALLVFELCVGLGQRIGDVIKMQWADIQDGAVVITQGKTGKRLHVPITRRLRAVLDATPRHGKTICAWGKHGRPITYKTAQAAVMDVRIKIDALPYDIHGLRYTTAAELAEAGCDDGLIASITGHDTLAMVAKYAGPARQKARAKQAQESRE